ncbi:hypothetical protein [Streptomyces noursei]|uniref:hypothetical protein n=1 Tax=Streptomyces noursei TaxID=1971 RepID=UPI0023B7C3B5|nr:hypothetical protein [Streptomyces noursei]
MVTQSPTRQLSDAEFDALLDQINAHHKATLEAVIEGKAKPSPLVLPDGVVERDDYSDLPSDAIGAFATSRDNNTTQADVNKSNVSNVADQRMKSQISEDDFDKQLDDQNRQNKQKYNDDQDQLTQRLKDSGHKHPEKQNDIVAALKQAGDWIIDHVWGAVKSFFEDLVQKLKDLWDKVVDWFKDKVNEIVNWWHGLFG